MAGIRNIRATGLLPRLHNDEANRAWTDCATVPRAPIGGRHISASGAWQLVSEASEERVPSYAVVRPLSTQ